MIRLLYNLLWPAGLALFLPGYLLKMVRRGGYRQNFGQRLGIYSKETRRQLRASQPIWLHAVSVGEVNVALKLADQLCRDLPGITPLLTTTTTTGYTLARRSAPPCMPVLYSPLDFWPIMRRAFRAISPRKIVLVEAELWPNMLAEAKRGGIPVVLANARLSPRSERRFRRFRALVAPLFRQLNVACVPTEQDAARWRTLGVASGRIRVVGNIKYDANEHEKSSFDPHTVLDAIGVNPSRPILLGGSTHPGEEELLADAFCCLRQRFSDLFMIVAPRHVERSRHIQARLRSRGLQVTRRMTRSPRTPDCLLVDTTGELTEWYRVARIAFIGKSLTARGGQNPVEPIVAGVPVLFGPHMENFRSLAAELIGARGAVCVENRQQLIDQSDRLLRDPVLRQQLVTSALSVIAPHRGATRRTATLVAGVGASQHLAEVKP